jgi:DNA-binding SARP family transcriptional activator
MICLLGPPHAKAAHVRGNKAWAITAYLALSGGSISRERLMSLLFEDADDPAAALRWNLA